MENPENKSDLDVMWLQPTRELRLINFEFQTTSHPIQKVNFDNLRKKGKPHSQAARIEGRFKWCSRSRCIRVCALLNKGEGEIEELQGIRGVEFFIPSQTNKALIFP